jgi:hypothetical protein
MHLLRSTLFLIASLAAGSADAAGTTTFTTKLFSIELPSDWRKADHPGKRTGLWTFRSPNGNYKLRIRAERDSGEPIATLGEAALKRFQGGGTSVEIVKKMSMKAGGRDVHWTMLKSKRKTHKGDVKDFISFRLMIRPGEEKSHLVVTVSASHEKVDDFMKIVDLVMTTFKSFAPGEAPASTRAPGAANAE